MSGKVAIITGGSKGLGFSLASALAKLGWRLLINARDEAQLLAAKRQLGQDVQVIALAGDMRDEVHLQHLFDTLIERQWTIDLVVNNASTLGISPMPNLLEHPIDNFQQVFQTNALAPISLLQQLKPIVLKGAKIINISSDAAVEAYAGWGAYGASKAALDHLTSILGKEYPAYRFYAFDPGDMRTDMHQNAFPNEDISDRPLPEENAVPALLHLIQNDNPTGRYTVSELTKTIQQTTITC